MIKTFAKKDIINNISIKDRAFTVTTPTDSIWVYLMVKLPNVHFFATIQIFSFENETINKIYQKSIVIFDNKEANFYKIQKYECFENKKINNIETSTNELIEAHTLMAQLK